MLSLNRDDRWLESRLGELWDTYFRDVPIGHPIDVSFGRSARMRFGSIRASDGRCKIIINGLLAHPDAPEFVIDATLAHELAHYAHGYGSGLPKLHAHPHRGGVIDSEMRDRGCLFLEDRASAWRSANWDSFYAQRAGAVTARVESRKQDNDALWSEYLQTPGFRTEFDLGSRLEEIARRFRVEPGFSIGWCHATRRMRGLSYRFKRENMVRVHGLAADPRVPQVVIDYELAYWLAESQAGRSWERVERRIREADLWSVAEESARWRSRSWTRFRSKHLPV